MRKLRCEPSLATTCSGSNTDMDPLAQGPCDLLHVPGVQEPLPAPGISRTLESAIGLNSLALHLCTALPLSSTQGCWMSNKVVAIVATVREGLKTMNNCTLRVEPRVHGEWQRSLFHSVWPAGKLFLICVGIARCKAPSKSPCLHVKQWELVAAAVTPPHLLDLLLQTVLVCDRALRASCCHQSSGL